MKEFKILPTNPDFQALTDDQVGFIMENMNQDSEIQALINKGHDPSKHISDEDDSWWEESVEDFNPKGNLDVSDDEIAAQVEALTTEEDRQKLAQIIEGNDEWAEYLEEEGNEQEQLTIENVIQENLRKAKEDAQRMSAEGKDDWGKASMSIEEENSAEDFEPMTQEGIEEAFKIFEGEEDEAEIEEDTGPDSDWI